MYRKKVFLIQYHTDKSALNQFLNFVLDKNELCVIPQWCKITKNKDKRRLPKDNNLCSYHYRLFCFIVICDGHGSSVQIMSNVLDRNLVWLYINLLLLTKSHSYASNTWLYIVLLNRKPWFVLMHGTVANIGSLFISDNSWRTFNKNYCMHS